MKVILKKMKHVHLSIIRQRCDAYPFSAEISYILNFNRCF